MQSELQPQPLPSRSTRAVKKFVIFILIIIAIIVAVFLLGEYDKYQNRKAIDEMASTIQEIQEADYNEAMRDTFGGTTPQETLSLYISALEKGDYELASKYFIGTKQKEELNRLNKSNLGEIKNYIVEIKKISKNSGEFSFEKDYFSFDGDILLNLKKYPNGIWKIIEI